MTASGRGCLRVTGGASGAGLATHRLFLRAPYRQLAALQPWLPPPFASV